MKRWRESVGTDGATVTKTVVEDEFNPLNQCDEECCDDEELSRVELGPEKKYRVFKEHMYNSKKQLDDPALQIIMRGSESPKKFYCVFV